MLAAEPGPAASTSYRPSGSPADLSDLGRLARLRDPQVEPIAFGQPDTPRHEADGGLLLAEAFGPGILQHMWFARASERTNPMAERIRILIDGRSRHSLDITLAELGSGLHPHFPRPLAVEGAGGLAVDVPIAFRDGCRIVAYGWSDRPYRITGISLPDAEGLVTFTETPSKIVRDELERARLLWSRPEDLGAAGVRDAESAVFKVAGEARSTHVFLLPDGPRTVRSFEVRPEAGTDEAWRSARLRLTWDGESPGEAGIDLTLGLAFGQGAGTGSESGPTRSVLVGPSEDGEGWSNRFPMPYRRQALLQIDAERPLKGTIRLRTVSGVEEGAGYFRAEEREARVLATGGDFEWGDERGRGHYVGAFLIAGPITGATTGSRGGVRFFLDGRSPLALMGLDEFFVGGGIAATGLPDRGPGVSSSRGASPTRVEGERIRVASYRWHLSDPVPYARSMTVRVEPGDGNTFAGGDCLAVFWYSEHPGPFRSGR